MNQTYKETATMRARKRRAYVWTLGLCYSALAMSAIGAVVGVVIAALTTLGVYIALSWGGYRALNVPPPPDDGGLIGGGGGWTILDLLRQFGPWLGGGVAAAIVGVRCFK